MRLLLDLLKDYRFFIGFVFICLLVFVAFLSFFSPYDPARTYQVQRGLPPSWEHLLGTTWLGQDVFWQLTFAVRNSLLIAFVASIISRIIATILGVIAGYRGGITDRVITSLGDTVMTLPIIVVLIIVASILRDWIKNMIALGFLLAFFAWPWDARVIRSQVLSLRERDFTFTALLCGLDTFELVTREYLPHLFPIIFTTFINNMSWAIGMEVTLAYLGLGLDPMRTPTIGNMLQVAIYRQAIFMGLWWWILTPVVTAILLFVSLYLLSLSLSEYLDPRMRAQRIGRT